MIVFHPFCCEFVDNIGLEYDNDSGGRKAASDLLADQKFGVRGVSALIQPPGARQEPDTDAKIVFIYL